MTLEDKIAFWDGKTDSPAPQPGSKELFEGVTEDREDDNLDIRDADGYKDVIIHDSSYRWLIASLQAEMALWDGGESVQRIRDVVLDHIPPGMISSQLPPSPQCVVLHFDWDPKTLMGGATSNQYLMAASKAITVVKTSTSFIACTVEDYMDKVWPCYGGQLVRFFDSLVGRHEAGTKIAGECTTVVMHFR
jgi:hypothetical protein